MTFLGMHVHRDTIAFTFSRPREHPGPRLVVRECEAGQKSPGLTRVTEC